MDLLDEVAARGASMVLMTGHASVDTAVEALRRGVTDYLTKPLDLGRLKAILGNVARTRELTEEIGELRDRAAAARPLRAVGRQLAGDGLRLRPAQQGRADRRDGAASSARAAPARKWSRRRCTSSAGGGKRSVPAGELRRGAVEPDRERAVRSREGQLHRRRAAAPGRLRAGRGRHAVPRRDHRDADRAAGEAAARARDRHRGARRRRAVDSRRRARDRRHQPRSRGGRCRRQAARGSLVPAEGVPDRPAAAARSRRRHRRAGRALPRPSSTPPTAPRRAGKPRHCGA